MAGTRCAIQSNNILYTGTMMITAKPTIKSHFNSVHKEISPFPEDSYTYHYTEVARKNPLYLQGEIVNGIKRMGLSDKLASSKIA